MKLDRNIAPIGTKAFLAPGNTYEFEGDDDWTWAKEPCVVLNDQRQWVTLPTSVEPGSSGIVVEGDLELFSEWKCAVMYTIQQQIRDGLSAVRQAQNDIKHASDVLERLIREAD